MRKFAELLNSTAVMPISLQAPTVRLVPGAQRVVGGSTALTAFSAHSRTLLLPRLFDAICSTSYEFKVKARVSPLFIAAIPGPARVTADDFIVTTVLSTVPTMVTLPFRLRLTFAPFELPA